MVRAASPHRGPWPRVSIWHGDADPSVHPVNAERLVEQWTELHGLAGTSALEERTGGHRHRVWRGPDGEALVESHVIAGMAHGAPIRAGTGPGCCGVAGPATLDVGISSTHRILEFWGLAPRLNARPLPRRVPSSREPPPPACGRGRKVHHAALAICS